VVVLRPKGKILTGGALAIALAAAPAQGAQLPRHLDVQAAARAPAPSGVVFGGITRAAWPVVVAVNTRASRVEQIVIGLDMTCTSGDSFGTADGFQEIKISKAGRFVSRFGPQRVDVNGVPAQVESKVIGRRNAARTSMRGIWSLKVTIYAAAGTTVTDTCESGLVHWTALQ
jgi:hypothetical protein